VSFSHSFGKKDGILKPAELQHLWLDYEPEIQSSLLELLEKLEFIFQIEKPSSNSNFKWGSLLVPYFLPTEVPDYSSQWPAGINQFSFIFIIFLIKKRIIINRLIFFLFFSFLSFFFFFLIIDKNLETYQRAYVFKVLPFGFFGRFTVRFFNFTKPILLWRTGSLSIVRNSQEKVKSKLLVQLRTTPSKQEEIMITVRGENPAPLLHSVLECMDNLVQYWYTDLKDHLERFVACPHCLEEGVSQPRLFNLENCEDALIDKKPLKCQTTIPILKTYKHLFLCDLPSIEDSSITLDNKKLGEGSFAEVFRGTYKDQTVAVKKLKLAGEERQMVFRGFVIEVFYMRYIKFHSFFFQNFQIIIHVF
jgi:hypothetical protein